MSQIANFHHGPWIVCPPTFCIHSFYVSYSDVLRVLFTNRWRVTRSTAPLPEALHSEYETATRLGTQINEETKCVGNVILHWTRLDSLKPTTLYNTYYTACIAGVIKFWTLQWVSHEILAAKHISLLRFAKNLIKKRNSKVCAKLLWKPLCGMSKSFLLWFYWCECA